MIEECTTKAIWLVIGNWWWNQERMVVFGSLPFTEVYLLTKTATQSVWFRFLYWDFKLQWRWRWKWWHFSLDRLALPVREYHSLYRDIACGLHENSLNCVTCYIKDGFFIKFVLTFHCSSDFLDPLRSPFRWLKRIRIVMCFVCNLPILELHNGYYIDWTPIIGNNQFSYPEISLSTRRRILKLSLAG